MPKFVYDGWSFPAVKAAPPNERFLKIIMSPEVSGYKEATVLFSHIPPGSGTGMHTHTSDEIMYVIGRGESKVGDEVTKLEADSVIFAPKGVAHECRNTSETETLKIFCVYIPPLELSELLAKLADKTKEYLLRQK
ncbi:MAG: cupin domain-containing protein [Dehalococcoidales bacterium]|nr:cupin domain-containing protein [Dehalococcoidales bacterium]MBU2536695.1 cupin domain-containing protein [Chloroflexota bacterium]